jgi:hypothetical protein
MEQSRRALKVSAEQPHLVPVVPTYATRNRRNILNFNLPSENKLGNFQTSDLRLNLSTSRGVGYF